MPEPPADHELDAVVAFVAAQQARPECRIAYLGEEAAGIAAELDGLQPPWRTTVRVARSGDRLAGVVVTEWDEDLGRSWIIGPWVGVSADDEGDEHDEAAWTATAGELVEAALAQVPPTVTRHEMCGEVDHRRLAALAAARGWAPSEVNHLLVADAAAIEAWPDPVETGDTGDTGVRDATEDDVEAIRPLHDAEFPDTYASVEQLIEGQVAGSRLVLVATDAGGAVVGYAAGEVHDDGEGYVDYVVVAPEARRSGAGRRLLVALARRLLDRSSLRRVALTVQDHRAPARALYQRLGFRQAGSLVGYRSWTADAPRGPRLDS